MFRERTLQQVRYIPCICSHRSHINITVMYFRTTNKSRNEIHCRYVNAKLIRQRFHAPLEQQNNQYLIRRQRWLQIDI